LCGGATEPRRARNNRHVTRAGKQLFVLRHAKSSWDDPGLEDHERPLAARGHRAAQLLGEHLRSEGIRPEQVLCSSARRTRETLDGVSPGGATMIEPGLYAASCTEVIERLQEVPDGITSVMVVGHNPAMQMLVLRLTGANGEARVSDTADLDGSDLGKVRSKFPTGGLATLTFDCQWRDLAAGCASLAAYVRPRALALDR
jgi:phosphohistidine phosphatase